MHRALGFTHCTTTGSGMLESMSTADAMTALHDDALRLFLGSSVSRATDTAADRNVTTGGVV